MPREGRVEDGQEVGYGDMIGRIVSGEDVKFFLVVKTEHRPDVTTWEQDLAGSKR